MGRDQFFLDIGIYTKDLETHLDVLVELRHWVIELQVGNLQITAIFFNN